MIRCAAYRMGKYGRRHVTETLAWHHEQPKLLHAYATLAELRRNRFGFLHRFHRLLFSRTPTSSERVLKATPKEYVLKNLA